MICLTQYLYWEASGQHLKCTDCPFYEKCEDEAKERESNADES